MGRANLNQHGKRQRELAKRDKRAAKDAKRAMRKAEARAARTASEPVPALATSVKTP
jgi:hypothetical protein